jgi:hypothetical protein
MDPPNQFVLQKALDLIKAKTSFQEQLPDLMAASTHGPEAIRHIGLAKCPDGSILVNMHQLTKVLSLTKSAISGRMSQCGFEGQRAQSSTSEIGANFSYLMSEARYWRKWIKRSKADSEPSVKMPTSGGGPSVSPSPQVKRAPEDPYWADFFTMT